LLSDVLNDLLKIRRWDKNGSSENQTN